MNIPNNATTIGGYAFEGCSGLTSLIIPNSVSYIGSSAFKDCNNLVSVEMSQRITSVEIAVFYGCSSLASISIPNGVTAISSSAFQGCSSLTSIIIPNSVTDIGKYSFQDCSSLSSITIPNSVVYIGYGAFQGCSDLDEIIIPEGVGSIGDYSFSGCSALSSVCISSSVNTIGNMVFQGCSNLNSIVVDNNNTVFDSRENCNAIIKTSTNELLYGCNNSIIPNGVSAILYPAFNGYKGITSLSIPASVTRIEDNAFVGCTELASINVDAANPKYDSRDNCNAIIETETNKLILAGNNALIPNSVTAFSQNAFKNCIYVSLPDGMEKITYNMFNGCDKLETIIIPASVNFIESEAFCKCTNLAKVIISDGDSELTFVRSYGNRGRYCFEDCPLDTIYIGRTFKGQYDYDYVNGVHSSPFYGKTTISDVQFGDRVTEIGRDAFNGCIGLTSMTLPESVNSIGYCAFEGCTGLSNIYIPNSVEKIEGRAFYGCKSLQSITIPKSIDTIEQYTFSSCEGLTSLVIPSYVNTIKENAFAGCDNLSDLIFEDDTTMICIESYNFNNYPIKTLYLGRSISANNWCLYNLQTVSNLTISKSVTNLSGSVFKNCKIKTLTFKEGEDTLKFVNYGWSNNIIQQPFDECSIDSIYMGRIIVHENIYSSRYTTTKNPFTRTESTFSLRIGNNIKEIGDNAFSGWKIDSLYIPKTVEKIGSSPFYSCSYLHDIFIEDGVDTLRFDEGIGFYGIQLRNLYLGRNISYPEGRSPFQNNKESLSSLTIGRCVTKINEYQFYGCSALDTLNIPTNIMEIGKDAFNLCRGLTFVNIEDCEEPLTIDNNFMNCELKKVYLGRNINYPDHFSPFSGLEYLDSLIIGEKVTAIGNAAFTDCRNLKDVVSYSAIVPETDQHAFSQSYLPSATLLVPYRLYDQYRKITPWSLFGSIKNFEGLYNLIYLVDGEEYKKDVVEQGKTIVAEDGPTKEGFTFSGWSEIPEIMPNHDVIITGSFEKEQVIGDVNGDGTLSVTDVGMMISFILGQNPEGFNKDAADMNGDSEVTVTDVGALITKILSGE